MKAGVCRALGLPLVIEEVPLPHLQHSGGAESLQRAAGRTEGGSRENPVGCIHSQRADFGNDQGRRGHSIRIDRSRD